MDVKQLEYLLAIKDEGSVSKAADKLYISQSALSQCLKKQEKKINKPLFMRDSNKLIPTNIGKIYLDGAKEIIDIRDEVYKNIQNLNKETTNKYKIATDPQLYPVVSELILPQIKKSLPNFNLEIIEVDSALGKQFLYNNLSNFSLICSAEKSNNLLKYIHLYENELVLCVPKSFSKDFSNLPFISLRDDSTFRNIQQELISKNGLYPIKIYNVDNFYTAKSMVEKQYGITFLPKRLVQENELFNIYKLKSPFYFNIIFAYHKYDVLNEECEVLLNLLIEHFNNEKKEV